MVLTRQGRSYVYAHTHVRTNRRRKYGCIVKFYSQFSVKNQYKLELWNEIRTISWIYMMLGKKRDICQDISSSYDQLVTRNRAILKVIAENVILCGKQNIALRGVMYDSYLLKDVHSVLVNFPREYAQESMMLYI